MKSALTDTPMIHPVLPSYAKSWFKFPAGY
jgi:hypothetical protein